VKPAVNWFSLKTAQGEGGAAEAARERQHTRWHGQGLSVSVESTPAAMLVTDALFWPPCVTCEMSRPVELHISHDLHYVSKNAPTLASCSLKANTVRLKGQGKLNMCIIFIARQLTDARYWYSNSVCPSVRLSVHDVPVLDENGFNILVLKRFIQLVQSIT